MIFIIILLLLVIIIIIIISNYYVQLVLIKGKKRVLEIKKNSKEETEEELLEKEKRREWFEKSQIDVYTKTSDNLKLHAHFIENKNSNIYTIIVHGYESKGSNMRYYAEKFFNMGYNALLVDLRTHGLSEGNSYGMGYLEKEDILSWIKYILSINSNADIILFGISMGAEAIMIALAENLPSNVKLAIEDSGFTNANEQLGNRLKISYHLPYFPFIPIISLITKLRIGYFFSQANALKSVSKTKTPILFIHGSKDDLVPLEMMDRLYNACSSKKDKLIVEGAYHISSAKHNEKLYWEKIKEFTAQYL
ncbi:alpha/beta hydrolase [Brachyspira pilosicoli]|uniref:Alpha/beta hydrolase n=1 Tax=Brachyspira pilosicoli TaxID=52584 RepID=A0A5C8FAK8_BRAPL|nr:alpha/beta hydrolase [Brachyspira pilosicoli]TXJ46803.1 alpha/beta hydrolase [Brachyspira pilosicoli]